MDLIDKNNYMEITYFAINDDYYSKIMKTEPLDKELSKEFANLMINYSTLISKKRNYTHIKMDVHHSLRIYNNYLKNNGFNLTNIRATDNLYWFNTFKYF